MMKNFAKLLLLAVLMTLPAWAQRTVTMTFNAVGNSLSLSGSDLLYHSLSWTTTGTVSACSVQIDGSQDGSTWTLAAIGTAQTCTSSGASPTWWVPGDYNYVRFDITSFTGSGNVSITYNGWTFNPYAPPTGSMITYGPNDLGFNATTVAAGATVAGTKLDVRGAVAVTVEATCTQTWNQGFQPYDETGNTAFGTVIEPITTLAANATLIARYLRDVATPVVNVGTVTAATATFGLPARAVAITLHNTSASAGTCTAHAMVQY